MPVTKKSEKQQMIQKKGTKYLFSHQYFFVPKFPAIICFHLCSWIAISSVFSDEWAHVGHEIFEGVVDGVENGLLIVDDVWDCGMLAVGRMSIHSNSSILPCLLDIRRQPVLPYCHCYLLYHGVAMSGL